MQLQDRIIVVTGEIPDIGGASADPLTAGCAASPCSDMDVADLVTMVACIRKRGGRAIGAEAVISDAASLEDPCLHLAGMFGLGASDRSEEPHHAGT